MGLTSRRTFLQRFAAAIAGTAAASTFDLERLLWVPTPIITVPALPFAGPVFVTDDWVAREVLHHLKRNLVMCDRINRTYDPAFVAGDQWPADVVRIRVNDHRRVA